VESQNSWRESEKRQVETQYHLERVTEAAEESHNPSQSTWRESQRGKWSHRPAEESHREAGGATDQLKRVTERQMESLNS
jgi:hypothetical protein